MTTRCRTYDSGVAFYDPNPPPKDLPDPLIYGPQFPELRLVMKQGKQVVLSRTNNHLRTRDSMFDETGTLTMGTLLLNQSPACQQAHRDNGGWCPLFCWYDSDPYDESGEPIGWAVGTGGTPRFEADCPGWSQLAACCQTDAQRRFFTLWCETFAQSVPEGWNDGIEWGPRVSDVLVAKRLDFPALVPEVWLNYLGPDKTADEELHLAENPSRVDFVMIAEGQKCVIEIDGKSHYADYNRDANRWVPDERLYTRNLKIERSLRRQGWQIFRFSDLEINTCKPEHFTSLVSHLPGWIPPF